jgi:hypothetical protein
LLADAMAERMIAPDPDPGRGETGIPRVGNTLEQEARQSEKP